jgi:hypothetical protein
MAASRPGPNRSSSSTRAVDPPGVLRAFELRGYLHSVESEGEELSDRRVVDHLLGLLEQRAVKVVLLHDLSEPLLCGAPRRNSRCSRGIGASAGVV